MLLWAPAWGFGFAGCGRGLLRWGKCVRYMGHAPKKKFGRYQILRRIRRWLVASITGGRRRWIAAWRVAIRRIRLWREAIIFCGAQRCKRFPAPLFRGSPTPGLSSSMNSLVFDLASPPPRKFASLASRNSLEFIAVRSIAAAPPLLRQGKWKAGPAMRPGGFHPKVGRCGSLNGERNDSLNRRIFIF